MLRLIHKIKTGIFSFWKPNRNPVRINWHGIDPRRIARSAYSFVSVSVAGIFLLFLAGHGVNAARPARPFAVPLPVAVAPYTISVFATSVPGSYTQPDSVAFLNGNVFVGYSNGVAKDGSDGKSSTIVEYTVTGTVVKMFSVPGHNDGLKANPETQQLWAMSNEDGNPSLTIIDVAAGTQANYTFAATAHGGGFDDIAFRNGNIYLSASNPANSPNAAPAIVQAQISGTAVNVTPVLMGNSQATDLVTGSTVTLNLQDPDSMIFDPLGDLVLDSQADSELVLVHHPGAPDQKAFRVPVTLAGAPQQVDDTVFATSPLGMILIADLGAETVYAINRTAFTPGAAFTSAQTSVGKLDLDTGIITPIVTGLVSPHGMNFIDVPDFNISFDPGAVTVSRGSKFSTTVNVARLGGLSGNVTVAFTEPAPAGFIILTPSVTVSDGVATIAVKLKGKAKPGIYVLPFTGTDATGTVRTAALTVVVQ